MKNKREEWNHQELHSSGLRLNFYYSIVSAQPASRSFALVKGQLELDNC